MGGWNLKSVRKTITYFLIVAFASAVIHDKILPLLKFSTDSLTNEFFKWIMNTSLASAFILLVVYAMYYFLTEIVKPEFLYDSNSYNREKELNFKEEKKHGINRGNSKELCSSTNQKHSRA